MRRKALIALVVLVISLPLSACKSSGKEFKSLMDQAAEHDRQLEYQSAADVYTKALAIKEDPEARTKLNDLNGEIAEIRELNSAISKLKATAGAYKSVVLPGDLLTLCDDLTKQISHIESLNTSGEGAPASYLSNLKESSEYKDFTSSVEVARLSQLAGGGHDPYTDATEINDSLTMMLKENPLPQSFLSVK